MPCEIIKSQKKSNSFRSQKTTIASLSQCNDSIGKKRNRRRRKISSNVSSRVAKKSSPVEFQDTSPFVDSETIHDNTNKENHFSHLNDNNLEITKQMLPSLEHPSLEPGNDCFSQEQSEKVVRSICTTSKNDNSNTKMAGNQFTKNSLRSAISIKSAFITSKNLTHALAEASANFPYSSPEGSLLLEEKKVDIINVARKCIRLATTATKDDTSSRLENLKVAVHCLRAICPVIASISNREIIREDSFRLVIKLLYHCINLSQEFHLESSKEVGWENCTSIGAAMVCFAGYQVLGVLLNSAFHRNIPAKQHTSDGYIFNKFSIHSPDYQYLDPTDENFTKEKITKIAVQSCFSLSTVLWNIHFNFLSHSCQGNASLEKELEKKKELFEYGLHFKDCVLKTLTKGGSSSSSFAFRRVLCSVSMSWILSSVVTHQSDKRQKESKPTETMTSVLGYVKRASKLLIDAASQLESIMISNKAGGNRSHFHHLGRCKALDLKESYQECLMLRQHYILVLLLNRQVDSSTWIPPPLVLIKDRWPLLRHGFINACSNAWKFAASHTQKKIDGFDATILIKYHHAIGLALDQIALSQEELNHSYVEYCAYRAIHTGFHHQNKTLKKKSNCCEEECFFCDLPFRYCHQRQFCCHQQYTRRIPSECVALAIFFIALPNTRDRSQGSDIRPKIQSSVLDNYINFFKETFLRPQCKIEDRSLRLSYKILALLKLNTTVFNFVDTKKTEMISSFAEHCKLSLFGRLLGECYAPLNSLMASRLQDGADKYHFIAMEGYTTSGLMFQLLSEASLKGFSHEKASKSTLDYEEVMLDCSMKSDRFIVKCSKIITTIKFDAIGCTMLDRVGKSLAYIGKRRMEKNKNMSSLLPLLLSLDAFCRAYTISPKLEYRIVPRFSQLASLFYSLQMRKEACVALLFSIKYQFHETLSIGEYKEENKCHVAELLLNCDDYLSNKFRFMPMSEGNNVYSSSLPLIKRLAQIYTELISRTNDLPQICLDQVTLNLIERLSFGRAFIEVCNSKDGFFLSQIVNQVTVSNNESSGKLRQRIGLACCLLNCLTNFTKDEYQFEINRNVLLQELESALQQIYGSLKHDAEFHHEYIAALLIVGAAIWKSIIKQGVSHKSVPSLYSYVQQADDFLRQSYEAAILPERRVTILAYRASVSFFQSKMQVTQSRCSVYVENHETKFFSCYEKVAAICSEAGKILSSNRLNCEIINLPKEIVSSLVLAFVKVYQQFDVDDASAPAAYHLRGLRDLTHGYEIMVGPLLLRGELHSIASLCSQETSVDGVVQNAQLLFDRLREGIFILNKDIAFDIDTQNKLIEDLLNNAYQLQLHVHMAKFQTIISSMDQLINIMQQQDDIFATNHSMFDLVHKNFQGRNNFILWLAIQWWLSSYTFALSEGFNRCGDIIAALHFARHSCILSQNAVKMTREKSLAVTSSDNALDDKWFGLPFSNSSTWTLPFISRTFQCQEYIGRCYCLVGDHRKAKQYAVSLIESLDLVPRDVSTKTSKLADILRVINPNILTIRHMKCRHSLIQTLLLEMSPSALEEHLNEFTHENYKEICKFPKECMPSRENIELDVSASCFDLLREKTRDLLLYGNFSLQIQTSHAKQFFDTAVNFSQNFKDIPPDLMKESIPTALLPHHLPTTINSTYINSETFGTTLCEVGLRLAQTLKEDSSEKNKSFHLSLLKNISESHFSSSACRAEAFYHLGYEFLSLSKQSGELNALWNRNCTGTQTSKISLLKPESIHMDDLSSLSSLQLAYYYFLNAAFFVGPASSLLSRHVLRCLALVSGPEDSEMGENLTAGELIHTSIGSSARQAVSRASSPDKKHMRGRESASPEESQNAIFDAFDLPISKSESSIRKRAIEKMCNLGYDLVPKDWNFVAMTICPTGELLISSLRLCRDKPRYRTVCVQTPEKGDCCISSNFFDEIVKPFDDLMSRSQNQLRGMNSENATDKFKDKIAKRTWWDERQKLDNELEDILNRMEERYFGAEYIEDILGNGVGSNNKTNELSVDISKLAVENLAAKFEAVCVGEDDMEPDPSTARGNILSDGRDSLQSKTVVKIKDELKKYDISGKSIRGLRKAALIDLLWDKIVEEIHQSELLNQSVNTSIGSSKTSDLEGQDQSKYSVGNIDSSRNVTFLILDEHLSRLPMEGMPTFRGKTICRIPSLPFAISTLHRSKEVSHNPIPETNPFGASYVLNPELDLRGTEKRLHPSLKNMSDSNKWEWKGIVGAIPSENFMERALKRKNGLFMYCGHGGGERFFSRSRIMDLISKETSTDVCFPQFARQCWASIILMGCSSGKLTSVNHSKECSKYKECTHYEAEGVALSYLCAGAPCIVANLWDVTDHDIDRFFLHLMDKFLGTSGQEVNLDSIIPDLAACVAESRMACKMRFIVGCAPVVYGVPVSAIIQ